MNEEEKKEVKVYVQGKLIPAKELEKEYPQVSFASSSGSVRVIKSLTSAEKPLNREDIARDAGLSTAFTRTLLKKLLEDDYVLEFRMGGRVFYYLLTEKGLKLSKGIADRQKR